MMKSVAYILLFLLSGVLTAADENQWQVVNGSKWSFKAEKVVQSQLATGLSAMYKQSLTGKKAVSADFMITTAKVKYARCGIILDNSKHRQLIFCIFPNLKKMIIQPFDKGKKEKWMGSAPLNIDFKKAFKLTVGYDSGQFSVWVNNKLLLKKKIDFNPALTGIFFDNLAGSVNSFSLLDEAGTMNRSVVQKFTRQAPADAVINWYDSVGSHYSPQGKCVGGLRGYPFHGVGIHNEKDHKSQVNIKGPFSDKDRHYDFTELEKSLKELSKTGPLVDRVLWSACVKNSDTDDNLLERIKQAQDCSYAHARHFASPRDGIRQIRFYQAGNEVNGLFFNPIGLKPKNTKQFYAEIFCSDAQRKRYVEMGLAPTAAALNKASLDEFGKPGEFKLVLGSVANSYNPTAIDWLDAVLDSDITGTYAPEMKGKKVWECVDYAAIHYTMNSGPPGNFWRKNLDRVYNRWVKTGKISGIWNTEENGTATYGAVDTVVTLPRWFEWWLEHDWKKDKGRIFFWSDWDARVGLPTVWLEQLMSGFIGTREFSSITGGLTVTGSGDLEGHAFMCKGKQEPNRYWGVLFSKNFNPGYSRTWADSYIGKFTVECSGLGNAKRKPEIAVIMTSIEKGFVRIPFKSSLKGDVVTIEVDQKLSAEDRQSLIFFIKADKASGGMAFAPNLNTIEKPVILDDGTILYSFEFGNSNSSESSRGMDAGKRGDIGSLVANRRNDHTVKKEIELDRNLSKQKSVTLKIDIIAKVRRGEKDPYEVGACYWDGKKFLDIKQSSHTQKVWSVALSPDKYNFQKGIHEFSFKGNAKYFAIKIDAISIK